MVTARTAFQIFKADNPEKRVSDFNALPENDALPFKVRAAEEKLCAAVDQPATGKEAAITQAAREYLARLQAYLPLQSASPEREPAINAALIRYAAEKLDLNNATDDFTELAEKYAAGDKSISGELLQSLTELDDVFRTGIVPYKEPKAPRSSAGVVVPSDDHQDASDALEQPNSASDVDSSSQSSSIPAPAASRTHAPAPRMVTRSLTGEIPARSQTTEGKGQQVESTEKQEGRAGSESTKKKATAAKKVTVRSAPGGNAPRGKQSSNGTSSTRSFSKKMPLVLGRLRALTAAEKKVVALLNQMIRLMAHIYTNRYNSLMQLFTVLDDNAKAAQQIIDTECANYSPAEGQPPEAFHDISLDELRAAIQQSSETFKDDEECRYELDEDLLHPIAHACVSVINTIEGYEPIPFEQPSDADKARKAAAREAAKAKREAQRTRILEKQRQREEEIARREEEKRLVRAQFGDVDAVRLEEDTHLTAPIAPGYVQYKDLSLEPELYEQSLSVWAMITSVPKVLMLSQMPFPLFLTGLLEDQQSENGLMEEVTRTILDVCLSSLKVSSPTAPRITTRGKDWFESMLEYVAVTSGAKKKKKPAQKKVSEDDEDDDGSSSNDSSDSNIDSTSSSENDDDVNFEEEESENVKPGEGADGNAAEGENTDGATAAASEKPADVEEEEPLTEFQQKLKETLEALAELGRYATWGNIEVSDRLNLLEYIVRELLSTDEVQEEAEKLRQMTEEKQAHLEKRVKEIRDNAEKDLKQLQKDESAQRRQVQRDTNAAAGTSKKPKQKAGRKRKHDADDDNDDEDDNGAEGADEHEENGEETMENAVRAEFDAKRKKLLADVTKKLQHATQDVLKVQDGVDVGVRIRPIGMDRYRRLYWRFPLDRHITVQSTKATDMSFPLLEPPKVTIAKKGILLDEDQEESESSRPNLRFRSERLRQRNEDENSGNASQSLKEEAEKKTGDDEPQRIWGIVQPHFLQQLVDGLDPRGTREGPLRKALEAMIPYVQSMPEPNEPRSTRSRSNTHGYMNRLKMFSMLR